MEKLMRYLYSLKRSFEAFLDFVGRLPTSLSRAARTDAVDGVDDFALKDHEHTEYYKKGEIVQDALSILGEEYSDVALANHTHPEYVSVDDLTAGVFYIDDARLFQGYSAQDLARIDHTHDDVFKLKADVVDKALFLDNVPPTEKFALKDHKHPGYAVRGETHMRAYGLQEGNTTLAPADFAPIVHDHPEYQLDTTKYIKKDHEYPNTAATLYRRRLAVYKGAFADWSGKTAPDVDFEFYSASHVPYDMLSTYIGGDISKPMVDCGGGYAYLPPADPDDPCAGAAPFVNVEDSTREEACGVTGNTDYARKFTLNSVVETLDRYFFDSTIFKVKAAQFQEGTTYRYQKEIAVQDPPLNLTITSGSYTIPSSCPADCGNCIVATSGGFEALGLATDDASLFVIRGYETDTLVTNKAIVKLTSYTPVAGGYYMSDAFSDPYFSKIADDATLDAPAFAYSLAFVSDTTTFTLQIQMDATNAAYGPLVVELNFNGTQYEVKYGLSGTADTSIGTGTINPTPVNGWYIYALRVKVSAVAPGTFRLYTQVSADGVEAVPLSQDLPATYSNFGSVIANHISLTGKKDAIMMLRTEPYDANNLWQWYKTNILDAAFIPQTGPLILRHVADMGTIPTNTAVRLVVLPDVNTGDCRGSLKFKFTINTSSGTYYWDVPNGQLTTTDPGWTYASYLDTTKELTTQALEGASEWILEFLLEEGDGAWAKYTIVAEWTSDGTLVFDPSQGTEHTMWWSLTYLTDASKSLLERIAYRKAIIDGNELLKLTGRATFYAYLQDGILNTVNVYDLLGWVGESGGPMSKLYITKQNFWMALLPPKPRSRSLIDAIIEYVTIEAKYKLWALALSSYHTAVKGWNTTVEALAKVMLAIAQAFECAGREVKTWIWPASLIGDSLIGIADQFLNVANGMADWLIVPITSMHMVGEGTQPVIFYRYRYDPSNYTPPVSPLEPTQLFGVVVINQGLPTTTAVYRIPHGGVVAFGAPGGEGDPRPLFQFLADEGHFHLALLTYYEAVGLSPYDYWYDSSNEVGVFRNILPIWAELLGFGVTADREGITVRSTGLPAVVIVFK